MLHCIYLLDSKIVKRLLALQTCQLNMLTVSYICLMLILAVHLVYSHWDASVSEPSSTRATGRSWVHLILSSLRMMALEIDLFAHGVLSYSDTLASLRDLKCANVITAKMAILINDYCKPVLQWHYSSIIYGWAWLEWSTDAAHAL